VTLLYAIGYPIGTLAVTAMTPMAVLVLRFGLAAIILTSWAVLARAAWPRGAQLGHVAIAGLLIQACSSAPSTRRFGSERPRSRVPS
jgi:hypothetical protein